MPLLHELSAVRSLKVESCLFGREGPGFSFVKQKKHAHTTPAHEDESLVLGIYHVCDCSNHCTTDYNAC